MNPNHDPKNGQFSTGPGGASLYRGRTESQIADGLAAATAKHNTNVALGYVPQKSGFSKYDPREAARGKADGAAYDPSKFIRGAGHFRTSAELDPYAHGPTQKLGASHVAVPGSSAKNLPTIRALRESRGVHTLSSFKPKK